MYKRRIRMQKGSTWGFRELSDFENNESKKEGSDVDKDLDKNVNNANSVNHIYWDSTWFKKKFTCIHKSEEFMSLSEPKKYYERMPELMTFFYFFWPFHLL